MSLRRDCKPRATLRVQYHLDADALTNALATHISAYETLEGLPDIMSRASVEKNIKEALRDRGEDATFDDAERDEDVLAWSRKQINHHFFPATKS